MATKSKNMIDVDLKGYRELLRSVPAWRHAIELVTNVFDEFLGYVEGMISPTGCRVTLSKEGRNPARLVVEDDGGGFINPSDIYTLFGSTEKRKDSTVAGRFNSGDKQLLAVAKEAIVKTKNLTVKFINGTRQITKHKDPKNYHEGTTIEAFLSWNKEEYETALTMLQSVIPPEGINYVVNDEMIIRPDSKSVVEVTLPTPVLQEFDGITAMKTSRRKTKVEVFEQPEPWLYELGIPVCRLEHTEYRYSLNVHQKIPLPQSRDFVSPAYLYRLIGLVNEAAAKQDILLVSEEDQGANFEKDSLEYVEEPEQLGKIVNAMRPKSDLYSSNTTANIMSQENGNQIIGRGTYGKKTLERLQKNNIRQTSNTVYGNPVFSRPEPESPVHVDARCPRCGFSLN